MHQTIKMLAALGLVTATFATAAPASARNVIVKQDYPSGPNIYRVEIRNMDRFKVLETGDSDGVGELHELVIELVSFNPDAKTQYDGLKKTSSALFNNSTKKGGGTGYLEIREGQHVKLAGHWPPRDPTQLWVHVYSNPDDAAANERYGARTVEFRVHALELDCTGQRVCRRNSKGSSTISFKIPDFDTPPSNRCEESNTFKLMPLDDGWMIEGLYESQFYSRAHRRTGDSPYPILLWHKTGGPRLMAYNLDICIASTVSNTQAGVTPRPGVRARGSRARTDTTELGGNSGNIPPVANDDSRVVGRCRTAQKSLTGNDADADGNVPLSIVPGSLRGPAWVTHSATHPNSHVNIAAPNVTAARAFTVQYTVQDTLGATDTGTLTINVNAFGPTC